MPTAGYSGTPLAKKLGINDGTTLATVGAPKDYLSLLEPMPSGVRVSRRVSASTDVVHVFSTRKAELRKRLASYRSALKPTATVWVSWPKKSAKVPTEVTEDVIRELALPIGFVDVKVCAVDEVWSGLKLVVRKELR
jgi:hypothetical protein